MYHLSLSIVPLCSPPPSPILPSNSLIIAVIQRQWNCVPPIWIQLLYALCKHGICLTKACLLPGHEPALCWGNTEGQAAGSAGQGAQLHARYPLMCQGLLHPQVSKGVAPYSQGQLWVIPRSELGLMLWWCVLTAFVPLFELLGDLLELGHSVVEGNVDANNFYFCFFLGRDATCRCK